MKEASSYEGSYLKEASSLVDIPSPTQEPILYHTPMRMSIPKENLLRIVGRRIWEAPRWEEEAVGKMGEMGDPFDECA